MIRPFTGDNRGIFLEIILQWCKQRDMNPEHWIPYLPEWGALYFRDDQAIAASFLRPCGGRLAMSDSTMTNPYAESLIRNQALNELAHFLFLQAKTAGLSYVLAFSSDTHTLLRMERLGFQASEKVLHFLPLETFGG